MTCTVNTKYSAQCGKSTNEKDNCEEDFLELERNCMEAAEQFGFITSPSKFQKPTADLIYSKDCKKIHLVGEYIRLYFALQGKKRKT